MPDADDPLQSVPAILIVSAQEQGVKLLRFLERRLRDHAPRSMLHKWIRTGQVRVNKKRARPHDPLAQGDAVRLPPFAAARQCLLSSDLQHDGPLAAIPELGAGLRVLDHSADCLVLAKAAGLATQQGSGHTDSVAGRLRAAFATRPFIPAPAHRLDKGTSGIVLAGMSHAAQKRLHALFRTGAVRKDYLAWIAGAWPHSGSVVLQDLLAKRVDPSGRERITALPGGAVLPGVPAGAPRENTPGLALCAALPLMSLDSSSSRLPPGTEKATLLLVRLLTGRKHQIRVQLASRGFPIIGDRRYKGPAFPIMLLHALALGLPPDDEGKPGREWRLPPEWPAPFMMGVF